MELTSHGLCSSPSTSSLFLSPDDSTGGRERPSHEVDVEAALASKPKEPMPLVVSPMAQLPDCSQAIGPVSEIIVIGSVSDDIIS